MLGTLGGVIKFLVMLGHWLIKPITELSLNINLVNKIFDFE